MLVAAAVVVQSDLLQVHVDRLKTFRTFRDNVNPGTKTVVEFIIQMESVLHRSEVIENDAPDKAEPDPTQAAERLIVRIPAGSPARLPTHPRAVALRSRHPAVHERSKHNPALISDRSDRCHGRNTTGTARASCTSTAKISSSYPVRAHSSL